MHRRLILTAMIAIFTVVALPRCSSCWEDPDDPKIWIKRLKEAETRDGRERALFNLYRIYEVNKALMEKDPKKKKELEKFRKMVNPVLVKVFNQKINNRYALPAQLIEKLVIFEAKIDAAAELFVEIIKKYAEGDADEYGSDDLQETLAAKAVDGLAQMAARGKLHPNALDVIWDMVKRICVKRGTGKGVEGLDPRSFVRNAVVKAMPHFLKGDASRSKLAKILAKIVHFGQVEKSGQDPMVTIFAIRLMGDVGDISDESVEALILSLLGKGRGRRFYSFAATAVAKLPAGADGKHPALEPLIIMLKGDPWKAKLIELKGKIKELEDERGRRAKQKVKDLQAELDPLEKKYKEKKVMPKCPYKQKYHYICKELFWKANVQEWAKTEPGVIPMNALMVLREIGDLSAVDTMIDRYGIKAVKTRWMRQAMAQPGAEDKKDEDLPGVQMQKMMIETYGADMNIRSVMLRSLGRLNAASKNERAKKELRRSLSWSGDPSMLVKAGEGIYLNGYDDDLMRALLEQVTRAASVMMVNFKKRQVKQFFWGKVTRGTCDAGSKIEKEFKECLMDPPKLPDEDEVKDANWNCFWKYRKYWLEEFYYAIGYHQPDDYKKLVHDFCKKEDTWWSKVRPKLKEKAQQGDKEAKLQLYACQENPDPEALKKGETVKCNQWNVCGPKNNYLCLDGHWQLRLHFYKHAALLATEQYADQLLKMTSDDIMKPHNIRKKSLPQKEGRRASIFYDSDDARYLNTYPWPEKVEKLRRTKAKTILEKRLCHNREFLRVVKRCRSDINCYVSVVKGAESMRLPLEPCDDLKPPYTRDTTKRGEPTWRHKVKALRMLAHLGRKAGPSSMGAKEAIKAAITYYGEVTRLKKHQMRQTRDMVLLLLDRVGSYPEQKNVMCPYPYVERMRSQLKEKYRIPRYEDNLERAKKYKRTEDVKKYEEMIKRYTKKVEKELAEKTKDQPCYSILKLIIEDETSRRVKGVWQINRDARNAIGRLARRAKMRYDQIPLPEREQ